MADRRKENFLHKISVAQQFVVEEEAASFMEALQSAVAVLETPFKESGSQGWLALLPLHILSSSRVSLETQQHSATPAPISHMPLGTPRENWFLGIQAPCQMGLRMCRDAEQ